MHVARVIHAANPSYMVNRCMIFEGGSTDGIIAGMDWVKAQGVRPAVVNMSIGGPRSSAMNAAIARLENAGFRTVVAAGNNNGDASNFSPASAATTFTVGNALYTGPALIRNPDSNYGPHVGLWAPGEAAITIDRDGSPRSFAGTSGASPHVAGWAAIVLSSNPSVFKDALVRYAMVTSKMTVSDSRGSGQFLYTRLDFVSMINESYGTVDFSRDVSFTSSQFGGVAPYSFTWLQNGAVIPSCTGHSSCTLVPFPPPLFTDVITLTIQDAAGRVRTDTTSYLSLCPGGGFDC